MPAMTSGRQHHSLPLCQRLHCPLTAEREWICWSFRNWRPVDTDAHVHDAYEYKYMIMIIITMTHIYNIHNIYIYIIGIIHIHTRVYVSMYTHTAMYVYYYFYLKYAIYTFHYLCIWSSFCSALSHHWLGKMGDLEETSQMLPAKLLVLAICLCLIRYPRNWIVYQCLFLFIITYHHSNGYLIYIPSLIWLLGYIYFCNIPIFGPLPNKKLGTFQQPSL